MEHEAGGLSCLAAWFAVDGVAEEGVAEEAIMDADLVSAAGVEGAKNEGGAIISAVEEVEICDGRLAGAGVADVHSLAVDWVAGDVVKDGLVNLSGGSLRHGEVKLGGFTLGKLPDEVLQAGVCLSGDDAA